MDSIGYERMSLTEVFTIGHSTLDYETFRGLLNRNGITAIADVRSFPQSRHFPHFDQYPLREKLRADGISYAFLGEELGGRPREKHFYCEGVADYEKMAEHPSFREGLARVVSGAQKYRIALMCSEHNPFDCHRCLLVGRALSERSVSVHHILSNGHNMAQLEIEEQLVKMCGHGGADMFAPGRERIADAYRERARQVAYRMIEPKRSGAAAAG